jgi:putative transposase
MREEGLITGEVYHVFNRGVDKRRLFFDDSDYTRFLESMYLFSDQTYFHSPDPIERVVRLASSEVDVGFRDELVEILAYCLIPNHYHLLIRQLVDDGISTFIHKVQMGYTRVFNGKHRRSGTLYEGTFKAIRVDRDPYFIYLPVYTHLNALDLTDLNWRDGLVDDWGKAVERLNAYPWSSHGAYSQFAQYLPLIKEETIKGFYPNEGEYLSHLHSWSQRHLSALNVTW